ncbi:NAD(P)-dependent oxidoreductase [Lysinibacillus xylanilyticus]|uniref:NAD(P)-binding domain-containing protein n=1 Tax=Lysinibacillus xylanilyticus TaxID=582475 RepID=A0ABT4EV05_9BACI|nr:NAD(P)-binding domain-containing protein [Lysinibacillus xylanilyticus]MCY9549505.1 NAD(P)-binding domain-containing protein [Lysinibacillus xylanilyticus]
MNNVTVIGLGSMGATLARVLLKKGYQVTVWNRSIEKAESLLEDGAILATSVSSAISASEVSIICLSDYKASISILDTKEVKRALSGRVLIELSTGSPQQARDNELWAQENNVEYLDGAIAASPLQMGNSEATIFTSGSLIAYKQSEQILKCLAGNVLYLGEQVSAASSTDLAFLSYLFGSYLGFFHAARILESDGLRIDDFGSMIAHASQVVGEVIKYESEVIQTETYDNPQSSINMCMTTVELFMVQAHEANINNEFPMFAQGLFKRALDAGYGNEEVAALIKVMR